MKKYIIVLAVAVVAAAQQTQAVPITFIHEGTGNAVLDGSSLGEVDFVITAHADTDDRINPDWYVYQIPHTSASVTFGGGRITYDILSSTGTFCNTLVEAVGFQLGPTSGSLDLFDGPTSSEFADWDMLSSIGPVSGSGELIIVQWGAGLMTNAGLLSFEGSDIEPSPATFTAIVVPEPASLLLLGLGAAMVRRKRSGRICMTRCPRPGRR